MLFVAAMIAEWRRMIWRRRQRSGRFARDG
jgi:hypothetical protein